MGFPELLLFGEGPKPVGVDCFYELQHFVDCELLLVGIVLLEEEIDQLGPVEHNGASKPSKHRTQLVLSFVAIRVLFKFVKNRSAQQIVLDELVDQHADILG